MMIRNIASNVLKKAGNRNFGTKIPSLKEMGLTSEPPPSSGQTMKLRPVEKSPVKSQVFNPNILGFKKEALEKIIEQLPNASLEQKEFLYEHLLKNINVTVVSHNNLNKA